MEGSLKLVGFKHSLATKSVVLAAKYAKAPMTVENINWGDPKREELKPHSPTGTFPYLETSHGVICQSKAIIEYLADAYRPELFGANTFEKAQVKQWIEFASNEIVRGSRTTLYTLFGWTEYNKADFDKGQTEVKEHLKLLNKHLEGKTFLVGSNITLADIYVYTTIRGYFELMFVDNLRKTLFPNVTTWLTNIAAGEESMKVYGRLVLCKVPSKIFIQEKKVEEKPKKEEKPKEKVADDGEEKPKVKKVNPLDALPPTTFDLDGFKRDFLNTKDKKGALERFWQSFDPNGFSFWWMEYQKLPSEGKELFKTNNSSSFFLQKIDSFRKYTFSVHGVYGVEGNYEIRGLWMWRGLDVAQEMKDHDSFPYMTVKKLDYVKDKQLIEEYWTKLTPGEVVEGIPVAEVVYFK